MKALGASGWTVSDWGASFIEVQRMTKAELLEYARRLEWFATDLVLATPIEDLIAYRIEMKRAVETEDDDTDRDGGGMA